jgi:DNA-binding HxlR family transcriptional regulator
LDLIGDKWTLLVIRDMLFFGKTQFGEFLRSDEGISTNILAERLKRLEKHGLIVKRPYQTNPPRYAYALTPRGEGLRPVMGELVKWSQESVGGAVNSDRET